MNSNGSYHAYRSLQSSKKAFFRSELGAERGCRLLNAFATATKIGLERVQVSFSTPGFSHDMRDRKVQEQYCEQVEKTGVQIASLGMGIFGMLGLGLNVFVITSD